MLSIKVAIHEVPNCAKQFYILPILNVYKQKHRWWTGLLNILR